MSYLLLVLAIGYLLSSSSSPTAKEIADEIEWNRKHDAQLKELKRLEQLSRTY
jgi:hypothetical protein